MRIYFDVYAIRLTSENILQIVEAAAKYEWTLDHLQDNMEVNAEDGWTTILYLKLFKDTTDIATFGDEAEVPDYPRVRLTDELDPKFGIFHKFEKI